MPAVTKSASPGSAGTATATATGVSRADVASAISSAQLLAANTARRLVFITNDDANTLYVKYGQTASATDYNVAIPGGGYWEMPAPIYTGRLDGIWSADGSGYARVTEET